MIKQKEYIGSGELSRIHQYLGTKSQRILILHGSSFLKNSGASQIIEDLKTTMVIDTISGVPENPEIEYLQSILGKYQEFRPDILLAIGGGSVIDTAKSLLAIQGSNTDDDLLAGKINIKNKPNFIAVPTTAGSGAEATHFAVLYRNKKKYSIANPALRPDAVILDPLVTISCPVQVTLSAGADAVCQAIESWWTRNASDQSRTIAMKALELLVPSILPAADDPQDIEAREAMLIGSHLAGQAINLTKTTAGHAMAYRLTTIFGLPHGLSVLFVMHHLVYYMEQKFNFFENGFPPAEPFLQNSLLREKNGVSQLTFPFSFHRFYQEIVRRLPSENLLFHIHSLNKTELETVIIDLVDSVNIERLANHPVELENKDIENIYRDILDGLMNEKKKINSD